MTELFESLMQDLLQRLFHHWTKKNFRMHKLKSHQQVSEAQSPTEMWHITGNNMADMRATVSLNHLHPSTTLYPEPFV